MTDPLILSHILLPTTQISWNTETLISLLKQVVAHRNAMVAAGKQGEMLTDFDTEQTLRNGKVSDCLGEVQEIIALPEYDSSVASLQKHPDTVELSGEVKEQMRAYVSCIASMYRENHFHNFEHARLVNRWFSSDHAMQSACNRFSLSPIIFCSPQSRHDVRYQAHVPHHCTVRTRGPCR